MLDLSPMRSDPILAGRCAVSLPQRRGGGLRPLGIGCDGDAAEAPARQLRRSPLVILSYVHRGGGVLIEGGRRTAIAPGTAILRLPDRDQDLRFAAEPRYAKTWLTLPAAAQGLLADLGLIDPARTAWAVADPRAARRAWQVLIRSWQSEPPRDAASAWSGAIGLLRAMAPMAEVGGDDPIARALALIDADPAQGASPRQLAARVGLGWHAFRSRFRAATGQSVTAYRLQARLDRAAVLLLDLPVAVVAERLGYANAFAFSAQFRRHRGMPPRAWQRVHRA